MAYMERLVAMDPLVGEACALVVAVELARRERWSWVVFESDSLVLCKEVLLDEQPSWAIASSVELI